MASTLHHAISRFGCCATLAGVTLLAGLTTATPARALEPGPTGFFVTGSARRIGPSGNEYTISHEMKTLPPAKTPDALRDADITKRFVLTFAKDVQCSRFKASLEAGFVRNGLTSSADRSRVQTLTTACTKATIEARNKVIFFYNAQNKTTTMWIEKMGTVTLGGIDAMRGVWSLWLGHAEDEKAPSSLVARL